MKKYEQILLEIEKRVLSKEYDPQQPIPTAQELAEEFDCSIPTIRKCLEILSLQGILFTVQGKGTFPIFRNRESEQTIVSLNREIVPRTRVNERDHLPAKLHQFTIVLADEELASRLFIEKNEAVYRITRIRYQDGEPRIVETNYLPVRLLPSLEPREFEHSLYEAIYKRHQKQVKHAARYFRAEAASEEDAWLLGMQEGDPIMHVESTSLLQNGIVVNYSVNRFHYKYFQFYVYS
ncbi:MAG: GntR family transcriptional regulator [Bacilli bacterium]